MKTLGPAEKDPNTSRLSVFVKMDSLEALYFRDGMKKLWENPEDTNDQAHLKRLEEYKDFAKEVWKETNPS